MGQRNPTALAEVKSLVDRVNELETAFTSISKQRSPTRQPHSTDVMISDDEFGQVEAQIKQLKGTLVRLAGQRNTTG
jgi:hypothetical protein